MARRKDMRALDGILLLDKPVGMTSNRALQRARHLMFARKAGHTGSLDPLASGLLPLCFGEATKVSAFLLDADKTYEVRIRLGERTDTADADGEVIATAPVPALDAATVETALRGLEGEQDQVPPMYSAVKHQGERLYKIARRGEDVERKSRRVTVHSLDLDGLDGAELDITVACSKGTYVRTLAEDIARALGTEGHVVALRRTRVGPFETPMHTLDEVEAAAEADGAGAYERRDSLLLPVDAAIPDWPLVELTHASARFIRQGQPVLVPRAPTDGRVRLYSDGDFLGIGEILDDGRIAPRRLLASGG